MGTDARSTVGPVPLPSRTHARPGVTGRRILALGVAIGVVLAGLGVGSYLDSHHLFPFQSSQPTLTIYTYESLWGGCGSANLTALLHGFEVGHHAQVNLECVSGTLSSRLISEKNAPGADLVIGLDEVTAPQADAAGVLVPYTPQEAASEAPSLQAELAPDHSVTPYEFGYLGIDYSGPFAQATHGGVANFSLPEVAANSTWSKSLMIEDPASDIVGEEFLLSEIAFYQQVMHANWTTFWKQVDPTVRVSDSWTNAYTAFTTPPDSPPMVVSFSTDPAAASGGGTPSFNSTLYHWNGTSYGWRTIYGIGIVKGTAHLALDQAFEGWFLQGAVQSEIPTNEWVYPANATAPLPPSFAWAADPTGAVVLNGGLPSSSIPGSLPYWLDEWQAIDNQYGG
ncbi:MAG: thiamine ABC transporter substrate-binding protein [Thermoplasmata archaeon]|nr:thiamine ABC transporter substrate-binding protein [Thermoplasmata archaeon]MCI4359171.1 thiamine ABC transporter substrate-binding protein [Thermoplasmata archaeon]